MAFLPETAGDHSALPFVSVAVRSYKRLPQLLELLDCLQAQDYPRFEIVVIEQSVQEREFHRAELEQRARDPRVRILEFPPLGAGGARDEAARQARGEVVLFIDDDDLPLGKHWILAHALNYRDPRCVAVSGRHALEAHEDPRDFDSFANHRRCLRYTFLKMPRGRVRHGKRIVGVTAVAGTNASIRKSAIARADGWEHESDHDEDSFNFRFARVRKRGEYFAYDPVPTILRRLDVGGGLERRSECMRARVRSELRYSHHVVRRYYPLRFMTFYPAYLWLALWRAYRHVSESQRKRSTLSILREFVVG